MATGLFWWWCALVVIALLAVAVNAQGTYANSTLFPPLGELPLCIVGGFTLAIPMHFV